MRTALWTSRAAPTTPQVGRVTLLTMPLLQLSVFMDLSAKRLVHWRPTRYSTSASGSSLGKGFSGGGGGRDLLAQVDLLGACYPVELGLYGKGGGGDVLRIVCGGVFCLRGQLRGCWRTPSGPGA